MTEASRLAIQFKSVGKSFSATGVVIQNLSLQVEEGEFVSILGPSGSGKTTILKLAAGLMSPDIGSVIVPQRASRTGLGYVFQESHLMPWKNVLDNVGLPLEIIGESKTTRTMAAEAALDLVGLKGASKLMPHELSGGMKMRASLARALVSNPKLLLLDEPFSALDEFTRYHLGEELRRIWNEKKITILFVTHSVSEATFISDRALIFSAHPLNLVGDVKIVLGQSRTRDIRIAPNFGEQLKKVYEVFSKVNSEADR